MSLLCIYHGNCADGFTAAWVVKRYFDQQGAGVEFHAGVYGEQPPDVTDRDVFIVDFSYQYDTLVRLSYSAKSVLILDHHATAQENLNRLPDAGKHYGDFLTNCRDYCYMLNQPHIGSLFDMDRSGAGITWDFFFPNDARPPFVDVIEDRDLWRFKLPYTRDVMADIFSYPYDFRMWDWLAARSECTLSLQEMIAEGAAIERKHHKDIAELIDVMARPLKIGGHIVPAASLPLTLTSDAGHKMAEGEPFAACYWDTPTGRVFSLRSQDDGLDVSKIAKQYGGGGHKHAAGFRVPLEQISQFEIDAPVN